MLVVCGAKDPNRLHHSNSNCEIHRQLIPILREPGPVSSNKLYYCHEFKLLRVIEPRLPLRRGRRNLFELKGVCDCISETNYCSSICVAFCLSVLRSGTCPQWSIGMLTPKKLDAAFHHLEHFHVFGIADIRLRRS